MKRQLSLHVAALVALVLTARDVRGQNPNGFIQSDRWACLVPLQGNDCTGGDVHTMKENWVAPHNIASENPVIGEVWDDIDFGGAAKSAAWRGAGDPTFVQLPGVSDVIDWNGYCVANGLTDDFIMGIAVTYVRNTTGAPLPVGLCTASDDAIQVWINNSSVLNLSICRGTAGDCSEINPAMLAPGVNRIAILVWDGFGGFGFRFGFTKPDGSKFTQADPEIEYLGATSSSGTPASLPVLTRSYAGSEFVTPGEAHTVRLAGAGFSPAANIRVCDTVTGLLIDPADVSNVSAGGSVAPHIDRPGEPVGDFVRRVVGLPPCSPNNDTTLGATFQTTATTGGDIWADGDTFEFAYQYLAGDFDISVEIVNKTFPAGGRWGKFGPMARQSLDYHSRFTHMQDHGPDLQDCARVGRRFEHFNPGAMQEPANACTALDPNDQSPLFHPRFLRLTRRADLVEAWVSNTAGDGDPSLDANWFRVFGDDWTGGPSELFVGFAYSVHNSSGCATGTIDWNVLFFDGVPVPEPDRVIGATVCWDAAGSVLNGAGLSYEVAAGPGTVARAFGHAGGANTLGSDVLTFQSAPGGPIGTFDNAHDIGERGPCTPGSLVVDDRSTPDAVDDRYTMTASGLDIWAAGDQFFYAYEELTGDFAIETHFTEVIHPSANGRWGKYGLMARWDNRPNSAYAFVHNAGATNTNCEVDGPRLAFRPRGGFNGGNGEPNWLWWQDILGDERLTPGCAAVNPDLRANDVRGDARNLAPFLRLVRRGNTFYGYGSDDGADWRILGSFSFIDAPETVLAGVAMTSHAGCFTQQVTFEEYASGPAPPIQRTVDPGDPLTGQTIASAAFGDANGSCPEGWICSRWAGTGVFNPQVSNGRLRLGEMRNGALGSGEDVGTTAFLDQPIDPAGAYVFDFDVFFSYDFPVAADNNPPGDGLTFCVLGTNVGTDNLGVRLGDRGGGIGYNRINMTTNESLFRAKDASQNSFALEFDNWHSGEITNDGDGSNVSGWNDTGGEQGTGTGAYHIGIDAHASTFTAQRNLQVGVHDDDLPDIYHPDGIHARVLYDHGHVRAWVGAGAGSEPDLVVADYEIEPVEFNSEQALVGFTAATGGATCVMEVDNFVMQRLGQVDIVFRRGDTDGSRAVNITDMIRILNFLFAGGPAPTCQDTADTDDSGGLNITDGIYGLNFLFAGGRPIPAPGPAACGPDPTADGLPACLYNC